MEKVLQGIPGVVCYIDDVLVTGRNDEEHLRNLEDVLKRLDTVVSGGCGGSTCHYRESRSSVPQPNDECQLRSFLGYYGHFVPDLATIAHPLNDLGR